MRNVVDITEAEFVEISERSPGEITTFLSSVLHPWLDMFRASVTKRPTSELLSFSHNPRSLIEELDELHGDVSALHRQIILFAVVTAIASEIDRRIPIPPARGS